MIGTIVGIVGAILTLLFGIYSVRIANNANKANSLSFSKVQCLSLFDSIVENIDDIEVKYRNSPVSKSVLMFEGKILNNGKNDIDKSAIHSPLKILIPKHFEILECNISSTSNKISSNCQSTKNEVQIDWDLLKKNEYIEFILLVKQIDVQPDTSSKSNLRKLFYNKIKFDFRITNIDLINKEPFEPLIEEFRKKRIKNNWWIGGGASAFGIILILTSLLTYNFLGQDRLNVIIKNKQDNKEFNLKYNQFLSKDRKIKIKSDEGEKSVLSFSQLKDNYDFSNFEILRKNEQPNYFNYFIGISGLLFFGFGGNILYKNYKETTPNNR